eukprot:TRINITY_DN28021_c0_g1_i1.p1 TRINITY_DN28021_c0_g1~~TRINITY_DN28021_c0_g1_i1.p1  ORF type:complete len:396 (-),score=94.91 TRINITY_DN28021_c0_g1_i1:174-1361(-)
MAALSVVSCRFLSQSWSPLVCQSLRRCASASSSSPASKPGFFGRVWGITRRLMTKKVLVPLPFVLFGGSCTLQHFFGDADDFFYGKFITNKDPDDLAEFYQAEDLLKIIAVHPFLFNLFMNKVDPDVEMPKKETALLSLDETHFHVRGLGMEVSFEIIQTDEMINGEEKPTSFMRHERFVDWVPLLNDFGYKQLLWDQTWVYGFKRLENGTVEVYHHGQKFKGPWPIRLIVFFHQYYVLWGCEKYINGTAFGTEDIDAQQEQLACIPVHVLKKFLNDLHAKKQKSLAELKDDPNPDAAAIAKTSLAVDKLKDLVQRDMESSTVSVARRLGATGSKAAPLAAKVVASDAATQEVLAIALMDAKGQKCKEVDLALKEMVNHPELDFKERPRKVKTQK